MEAAVILSQAHCRNGATIIAFDMCSSSQLTSVSFSSSRKEMGGAIILEKSRGWAGKMG